MSQSVLEHAGEQFSEAARSTSRAASAVADAFEDGVGAARRVAKNGSDAAVELFEDTRKHLRRHPIKTVAATFAVGVAAGSVLTWILRRR
jgi:ElaB/YqjD/DUF883 family membrane-anchored ribosome-binding protein